MRKTQSKSRTMKGLYTVEGANGYVALKEVLATDRAKKLAKQNQTIVKVYLDDKLVKRINPMGEAVEYLTEEQTEEYERSTDRLNAVRRKYDGVFNTVNRFNQHKRLAIRG